MTINTPKELVEIELSYDCSGSVPARYSLTPNELKEYPSLKYKEGTLTFKDFNMNPNGVSIKVNVPVEATTSKQALQDYIDKEREDHCAEFATISNVNIWDGQMGYRTSAGLPPGSPVDIQNPNLVQVKKFLVDKI